MVVKSRYDLFNKKKLNSYSFYAVGNIEYSYVAKDSPCLLHLNLHAFFNSIREFARNGTSFGPKVLICGAVDSGKSTLSQILLNYSTRAGHSPIFVDLDVGQSMIGVPGSLNAVLVDKPNLPLFSEISSNCPISFYCGSPAIHSETYDIIDSQLACLARIINMKIKRSSRIRMGGCIINSSGFIEGLGYKLLLRTIELLNVTHIIVIDQDRLYNQLKSSSHNRYETILVPKSGAVVPRSREMRREYRESKIRSYFYGLNGEFSPYTFDISFADVKIFKIGIPPVSEFFLPLGSDEIDPTKALVHMEPENDMLHHMLGVSAAETEGDVAQSGVLGYIVITKLDMQGQTMTVFSPSPSPLPKRFLVYGEITFYDFT